MDRRTQTAAEAYAHWLELAERRWSDLPKYERDKTICDHGHTDEYCEEIHAVNCMQSYKVASTAARASEPCASRVTTMADRLSVISRQPSSGLNARSLTRRIWLFANAVRARIALRSLLPSSSGHSAS